MYSSVKVEIRKIPDFIHTCTTCSELPSPTRTMIWPAADSNAEKTLLPLIKFKNSILKLRGQKKSKEGKSYAFLPPGSTKSYFLHEMNVKCKILRNLVWIKVSHLDLFLSDFDMITSSYDLNLRLEL